MAVFWAICTEQGARDAAGNQQARDQGLLRMIEIQRMLAANPETFELATTADEAERIAAAGKRVVFISMENASPLASDPSLITLYYKLGLRMIGIGHFANNDFGDSSTNPAGLEWHELSPKGRELVAMANNLGILLNASHASDDVLDQLLELSTAPIVLSHSGAEGIYAHPRNVDDARIRELAKKGGLIQANAYGGYLIPMPKIAAREQALKALSEKYGSDSALDESQIKTLLAARDEIDLKYPVARATFDDYMRHLLHLLEVVGPEHVGIGADWDGGGGVTGMEDVSALPRVTEDLLQAGYSEKEIRDVLGGNLLGLVRAVQAKADEKPKKVNKYNVLPAAGQVAAVPATKRWNSFRV